MKLINLLLLGFLSFQAYAKYFSELYSLGKYDYRYIYYPSQAVCVDLSNYKDGDYIYFTFTIYNGKFYSSDQNMYYDTFSSYGSLAYLNSKVNYYSYTYDTYYSDYYDKYTLKYELKKPSSGNYLCVGPADFYRYYITTDSYVEIRNVSSFGLSVGIIVVIVIACVAVVAASIIVYFCRRARRASYIAPPVVQYQPPVATAYPPPTYY